MTDQDHILLAYWWLFGIEILLAAFDISVTSPLNSALIVEAGTSSGVAARVAEECKHEKNEEKCSELGDKLCPN